MAGNRGEVMDSNWTPDALFQSGETGMWLDGNAATVYFPHKLNSTVDSFFSSRLVMITSRDATLEELEKMREWVAQGPGSFYRNARHIGLLAQPVTAG